MLHPPGSAAPGGGADESGILEGVSDMDNENNILVLHDALLAIRDAGRIATESRHLTIGDVTLFYAIRLRHESLVRSLFGTWTDSWLRPLVVAARRLTREGAFNEEFTEESTITLGELSKRKSGLFASLGRAVRLLLTDTLPGGPLDELYRRNRSAGGFRIGCPEMLALMALSPSVCLQKTLCKSTESFPTYTALRNHVLDAYAGLSSAPRDESRREVFARVCRTASGIVDRLVADLPGQEDVRSTLRRTFARVLSDSHGTAVRSLLLVVPPSLDSVFAVASLQAAFTEAGLQPSPFPPTDIGCYLHREAIEADLLGSDSTYRNARQGMLWDWTEHAPTALFCIEGLGKGGAAYPILLALLRGTAVDKFHRQTIRTPGQTVAFVFQPEPDDAAAYRDALEQGTDAVRTFAEERLEAGGCGQAAEVVRLCSGVAAFAPPEAEDLEALAENLFHKELESFGAEHGIAVRFDASTEGLGRAFVQASSDEPSLTAIAKTVRETVELVVDPVFESDPPETVELSCDPVPPYRGNPARRTLRGDFLAWKTAIERSGGTLSVRFGGFAWDTRRKREFESYTVRNPKECPPLTGVDSALDELRAAARAVSEFEEDPDLPLGNTWFLLEGPPGIGKTSLAVALSREFDLPIFTFDRLDESHALERFLSTARKAAPDIVVLDEADTLSVESRYALQRFLDGVEATPAPVVGLLTTNHPERLAGPLLRPGRVGRVISLAMPDAACRAAYLKSNATLVHETLSDAEAVSLAENTDGLSYAHLHGLLVDAAHLKKGAGRTMSFPEACRKALPRVRGNDAVRSRAGRVMGFRKEA